jgi:hypothetical protein
MINKLLKILKIKLAGEVVLKDGNTCVLDGGDLAVGVGIQIQTTDGLIPLPSGSYELETGEIIIVEDGKIVDIVEQVIKEEVPDSPTTPPVAVEIEEKKELPIVEIPVVATEETPVTVTPVVEEIKENPLDVLLNKITSIEEKLSNLPNNTDEISKLKEDVLFIMNKITLGKEVSKSKPVDTIVSTTDSRIDIINSMRNNKK